MIEIRLLSSSPTSDELDAVTELRRTLDREVDDTLPPVPPERALLDLTATSELGRNQGLIAWDGATAVGGVQTWQWYGHRNRSLGHADLGVHPNFRRRGVGTALTKAVAAHLIADERDKLTVFGLHAPGNVAFWESLDAAVDYTERGSRLRVGGVDETLMADWIQRRTERAADLQLVRWQGDTPDEYLPAFRLARDAMNDAPHHDLEWERGLDALDEVNGMTQWWLAMRRTPWTLAAFTPDGEIAGYTRIDVDEISPQHSWQDDTGVVDAHRGRGIGRWVKAEMWRWLREEAPQVSHLETENATDNEAMLAINVAMGFEPTVEWAGWQPDIHQLATAAPG